MSDTTLLDPYEQAQAAQSAAHPPAPSLTLDPHEMAQKAQAPAKSAPLSPSDTYSKIYHGILQGGAMTAAGMMTAPTAAATMGMGPVAASIAAYPAGKYVADAIDRIRGVVSEQESLPKQLLEGGKTEAETQLMAPIVKPALETLSQGVGGALKGISKLGESLSGTPASNLSRAFKGGFIKTFISPLTVDEAGDAYGEEFNRVMGDHYTPEQQADLLLNPNGIAKDSLQTAIVKAIKGEPVSLQEAIAARQGISQLMPSSTAKSLPRVAGFSSFRGYLNDIIGKADPDFMEASDNYAASKLRDQLLKFAQVNKSNPNEYSKLGMMFMKSLTTLSGYGLGSGHPLAPMIGAAMQGASSPFAMGLVSAASGTASRLAIRALENPLIQRSAVSALNDYFGDEDSPQGDPLSAKSSLRTAPQNLSPAGVGQ